MDAAYGEHLVALRDVWDRQEAAIARALPLTVDDDPLNLLDQRPAAPATSTPSAALRAGALRAMTTTTSTTGAWGGTRHSSGSLARSERLPLTALAQPHQRTVG